MKSVATYLLTGLGAIILMSQRISAQSVSMDGRILSSDDDFHYSNPNDHYKPNQYVKFGHWMSRSNEFEANTDFIKNAAYMPAILAGCGILAFILINLFFFFRCCCKCIACLPDETEEKYKVKRFRVLMAFYFVLFAALAFDQLMFLGNYKIGKAVDSVQGSIDYIGNLVDNVIDDAATLVNYGGDLVTDVSYLIADVNSCPYAQSDLIDFVGTANSTAYEFNQQSSEISSKSDDVDKIVSKAHNYVNKYGNDYRFKFICAIWLIAVLAVFSIVFTHMCRAKCVMQTFLLWVWIVFLIFLVLGALWGIIVTTMGTFCMTPLYTLNKLVPSGDFRNNTLYYTACQGEGVIQSLIDTAITQITDLNNTLTNITATAEAEGFSTYCPGNTLVADVQSVQSTLTGVVATIQDVEYQIGCESVQVIFFDIINEAWCTHGYTGVFYIWGSMLWTNFFLFISVLVASYVWQYYAFWNGVPVTEVNHDFEQVNVNEDEDSDEERGGVTNASAPSPERQAFFDSPHQQQQQQQQVQQYQADPYADPNAHVDTVIPAQIVYVNHNQQDEGDVAMVDMSGNRDSKKKKKGPKKAKRSSDYDQVDGSETQI